MVATQATLRSLGLAGLLLGAAGFAGCQSAQPPSTTSAVTERDLTQYTYEVIRQRAQEGHPYFQQELAASYRHGVGVSKDLAKALEWELKAAEQKQVSSYVRVGNAYLLGRGTKTNELAALYWYNEGIAVNDMPSILAAAELYDKGKGDVKRDIFTSVALYKKASRLGDEGARSILGERYGMAMLEAEDATVMQQKIAKQNAPVALPGAELAAPKPAKTDKDAEKPEVEKPAPATPAKKPK